MGLLTFTTENLISNGEMKL